MHSVETCREMISLYIEAEKSALAGQSYKIGTRELTRANLSEIVEKRKYWENQLQLALNGGKRRKSFGVVIRDL